MLELPALVVGALVVPVVLEEPVPLAVLLLTPVGAPLPDDLVVLPPVAAGAPELVMIPAATASKDAISGRMDSYRGAAERRYACASLGRAVYQAGGEAANDENRAAAEVGLAKAAMTLLGTRASSDATAGLVGSNSASRDEISE